MNKLPTQCPMCQADLEVIGLYCSHCDTTIQGHFAPTANPFNVLNQEQMHFLMTFIRCEGRFNRMEEELNLSYQFGDRAAAFLIHNDRKSAHFTTFPIRHYEIVCRIFCVYWALNPKRMNP